MLSHYVTDAAKNYTVIYLKLAVQLTPFIHFLLDILPN